MLVDDEIRSEKWFMIGSGLDINHKHVDLFVRPCDHSLYRLHWKTSPIHTKLNALDLDVAQEDGIQTMLRHGMQHWYAGSLAPNMEHFAHLCGSEMRTTPNGFPTPWESYHCTPLKANFASLSEYQLFHDGMVFVRASDDCGALMEDWFDDTLTQSDDVERLPTCDEWSWDYERQRYTHSKTNDVILRLRKRWGKIDGTR